MAVRLPFFGLISLRSPLLGFLEHYEQIAKGMRLIEESMECYITSDKTACKEFNALQREVNAAEEKADTIKRNLRNHLPRNLFLPVDKHIFFVYTRHQDDILDNGQDALQWLAMRDVSVPEEFQKDMLDYLGAVSKSVQLLRPALESTIAWVMDEGIERSEAKQQFRAVRVQHKYVSDLKHALNSKIYCSDRDFKDIYQLIHFVEHLHRMSHNAEGCVDLLRVMLAK